jgi:hypothetical protein
MKASTFQWFLDALGLQGLASKHAMFVSRWVAKKTQKENAEHIWVDLG